MNGSKQTKPLKGKAWQWLPGIEKAAQGLMGMEFPWGLMKMF